MVVCSGWWKSVHVLRELGVELRWPLYKKPTCVIDVETNLPCNFRSSVCVGFGGVEVEVLKKNKQVWMFEVFLSIVSILSLSVAI